VQCLSKETRQTKYSGDSMKDKQKELVDKMNHGVSRLSPASRKLYFSLCHEFLSRSKAKSVKTPLRQYANHIGITADKIPDIIRVIALSFDDIHLNTFHKYEYTVVPCSDRDDVFLVIIRIDNTAEIKRSMEIVGGPMSADCAWH
jgi:hypothetical protein